MLFYRNFLRIISFLPCLVVIQAVSLRHNEKFVQVDNSKSEFYLIQILKQKVLRFLFLIMVDDFHHRFMPVLTSVWYCSNPFLQDTVMDALSKVTSSNSIDELQQNLEVILIIFLLFEVFYLIPLSGRSKPLFHRQGRSMVDYCQRIYEYGWVSFIIRW